MIKWLQKLLLKEEDFDSHINMLTIKLDRIPNPTSETREVSEVPTLAHRTTARNALGKLLLKRRFKRISFPAGLTCNGTVLEVYPFSLKNWRTRHD